MDRGAWWPTVHGVGKELGHDLATKGQQQGKTRYRGKGYVFSLESIEEGRKKFSQMRVLKNE